MKHRNNLGDLLPHQQDGGSFVKHFRNSICLLNSAKPCKIDSYGWSRTIWVSESTVYNLTLCLSIPFRLLLRWAIDYNDLWVVRDHTWLTNVPLLLWIRLWTLVVFKPMHRTWRIIRGRSEPLESMIEANIRTPNPQVIQESLEVGLDLRFLGIHLIWRLVHHYNSPANVMIRLLILTKVSVLGDQAHNIVGTLVRWDPRCRIVVNVVGLILDNAARVLMHVTHMGSPTTLGVFAWWEVGAVWCGQ